MGAEKKKTILEVGADIWSAARETGSWVGGALKGEFNDKATLGQIIVDAVISMFPVAGEVTAVRDLIAIVIRMVQGNGEVKKVLNWVGIVLCLLPLIPVFGGVVKGVGRLLVVVIKDATKASEIATAILAFLRKMGYGDPIKFINSLKFSQYQTIILKGFKSFIARFKSGLIFFVKKMGSVLPEDVRIYVNSLIPKLDELAKLADKMIPSAIKELDQALEKVRTEMIRQMNKAGTKIGGGQTKVLTTEGRLGSSASKLIRSKGHTPAPLSHYKHKDGWPDLRGYKKDGPNGEKIFPDIHSFSVKAPIEARLLKTGTKVPLFRVVEKINPGKSGGYWAEKMSENGKAWRLDCAVKGAWSNNGAYVVLDHVPTIAEMRKLNIRVPDDWDGLRVWRGKIAEQLDNETGKGHTATNMLLPGGDIQIFINFRDPHNAPVKEYIDKMINEKLTNWKDAKIPDNVESMVEYLEKRERSAKIVQQGKALRTTSSTTRSVAEYQNQKKSK